MPLIDVDTAADLIANGKLAAFATETVYGLGGDATNDLAVASIYQQKGRPEFNPLIVHFADIQSAETQVEFNSAATTLANFFWPGPLTLVLNRKPNCSISKLCSAGGRTLAVRVPAHTLAAELLRKSQKPIAAPSANSSGKISPTSAQHVVSDFGHAFPVVDGGLCEVGLESTVVDLTDTCPKILRPGSITTAMIEQVLNQSINRPTKEPNKNSTLKSPGMLSSHYAPDKSVRINASSSRPNEFYVGFGRMSDDADFNLSKDGDLLEAAANLFNALHLGNASPQTQIAFATIPNEGIGLAINDRLTRAAAPR